MSLPIRSEQKAQGLFYGWYVVALAFLSGFITAGAGTYSYQVLFVPMSRSFGIGRTALTATSTIRTITSALFSPFLGPLADRRHGARILTTVGAVGGGLCLLALSQSHKVWQLYLFYGLLWGIAGVGAGDLVTNTSVAKWFVRRRGRAVAVSQMGISSAGIVMTPITAFLLLRTGDWRMSWVVLGVLMLGVLAPAAAIWMRGSPEEMGLKPDGNLPASTSTGVSNADTRGEVWTMREAAQTPTLWFLVVAINLVWFGLSALFVHQVAFLLDKGFSTAIASSTLAFYAIWALLAKPVWGFIAERVPVRYCLTIVYSMISMAFLLLALLTPKFSLLVYAWALFQAIATGAAIMLQTLAYANYFGRTFLGSLRGTLAPINTVSNAAGPLVAALIYDTTKSYEPAFLIFALLALIGAAVIFLARPPSKRVRLPQPG